MPETITFSIARKLIEQAAAEGRTIKVTVQGPRRILARLGDPATKGTDDAQG
jgi:hypothetical protein